VTRRPGATTATPECGTECLDRAPVQACGVAVVVEVVVEGQVDDAVGRVGACAQCVQILKVAAQNLGPRRRNGFGRYVRSGQTDHAVTCVDEFRNHGRADEAGRAGDEYPHENLL
jgi:hypothetical protein